MLTSFISNKLLSDNINSSVLKLAILYMSVVTQINFLLTMFFLSVEGIQVLVFPF